MGCVLAEQNVATPGLRFLGISLHLFRYNQLDQGQALGSACDVRGLALCIAPSFLLWTGPQVYGWM